VDKVFAAIGGARKVKGKEILDSERSIGDTSSGVLTPKVLALDAKRQTIL
jgi:hypothetical protein